MRQLTSCRNLNLMVKAIYLQGNTYRSFCRNVINIRLLILVLLAGYLLLLSKDESNAGWKHFTWFQFAHEFLDTLKDYDSNKLRSELQALRRKKGESSEEFSVRISLILCKFHINDLPS